MKNSTLFWYALVICLGFISFKDLWHYYQHEHTHVFCDYFVTQNSEWIAYCKNPSSHTSGLIELGFHVVNITINLIIALSVLSELTPKAIISFNNFLNHGTFNIKESEIV